MQGGGKRGEGGMHVKACSLLNEGTCSLKDARVNFKWASAQALQGSNIKGEGRTACEIRSQRKGKMR